MNKKEWVESVARAYSKNGIRKKTGFDRHLGNLCSDRRGNQVERSV